MTEILKHFIDPNAAQIGDSVHTFMDFLQGPAAILLTGEDRSRTRAFVTLLHGNEPSGLLALFRWLKSGRRPAINTLCVIASVKAASAPPVFSQRMLESERDLNRCFTPPYDDAQGLLAQSILEVLHLHKPEAVIDMHNTSGSGPAFAVATHMDQQHDALTSLFTERLVITSLKLGALMEISEHLSPTVTIECGGRQDEEAHAIAWDGLQRYFSRHQVLASEPADWGLELLHNPVRLELSLGYTLCYAEQYSAKYDLSLPPSIEHLNSGITKKDTLLGWVDASETPSMTELFSCKNSREACVLKQLLYISDGKLLTCQDLKLFMITTNPLIAQSDCLFYAVKSDGSEIVV
jgi:succinylglutamate desuccinylase/aspartoacylase family protein